MTDIGKPAPEFDVMNQEGERVRLSDYRGKNVILFAFPTAHELSMGCNTQACGFRDEFPKVEAGNAVVLGFSPDSVQQLKKWHTSRKLQYDLLSDPDHKVLEAYGAIDSGLFSGITRGVRRSYWVIDGDGIVRDQQIGVSPGESVKKALASLAQITAAEKAKV